jgi:hypothetical protein
LLMNRQEDISYRLQRINIKILRNEFHIVENHKFFYYLKKFNYIYQSNG